MLVIRKKQMKVLSEYMLHLFENLMVAHLGVYFHDTCKAMGEEAVRREIRCGIERAGAYGIRIERDVSRYINLMFMLGRDFDRDISLPWAGDILNNDSIGGPSQKMDALYAAAEKHSHNQPHSHFRGAHE